MSSVKVETERRQSSRKRSVTKAFIEMQEDCEKERNAVMQKAAFEKKARMNNFTCHFVPPNGNCFFECLAGFFVFAAAKGFIWQEIGQIKQFHHLTAHEIRSSLVRFVKCYEKPIGSFVGNFGVSEQEFKQQLRKAGRGKEFDFCLFDMFPVLLATMLNVQIQIFDWTDIDKTFDVPVTILYPSEEFCTAYEVMTFVEFRELTPSVGESPLKISLVLDRMSMHYTLLL